MWPAGADSAANGKCKSKPLSFATPAPWTIGGAAARGIPHVTGLVPAAPGAPADAGGGGGGAALVAGTVFGLPKMAVYIGGGVLGLGLIAAVNSMRKKR
jgi:hypothetical protein